MRQEYRACAALVIVTSIQWACVAQEPPPEASTLTLRQAIARALQENPSLHAFSWDIRAAEADILQAGLRPNPELEFEIEDLRLSEGPRERVSTTAVGATLGEIPTVSWDTERASGAHSGLAESEVTLAVSQIIELGKKRAKRIALASSAKQVTLWDYEAARADVIADVARAFTALLVAQERIELQQGVTALAEDVVRATSLRVKAGKVSPLEATRAEITLERNRVATQKAEHALEAARMQLAALWGSARSDFGHAVGALDAVDAVAPTEVLVAAVKGNPDLARWAAELEAREAAHRLERARRVPDLTIGLGIRSTGLADGSGSATGIGTGGDFSWSRTEVDFDSDRDNSLVLGFSLPLPLFDRNQGNIARAEAMVSKVADERRAAEASVVARLATAREDAVAAYVEVIALREDILPRVTETFTKTQRGYEAGKFSYLSVLDAQSALLDTRTSYLEALEQYRQATIDIERLTGDALTEWASAEGELSHEE